VGSWLHACPLQAWVCLSDLEIRIAVGMRLGCPMVSAHACVCGMVVHPNAHHGRAGRRSADRQTRHHMVNDLIARARRSAGISAVLETSGLLRSHGKRPDGASLIPWSCGKTLVWDFTCPDTFAPSHLINKSRIVGAAASAAESRKEKKYSLFAPAHIFVLVAIEIMGVWGPGASDLIRDLGGQLAVQLGDPPSWTLRKYFHTPKKS